MHNNPHPEEGMAHDTEQFHALGDCYRSEV